MTKVQEFRQRKDRLFSDLVEYITEKVETQYNGLHELDPMEETFFEAGIENDDMIITTILIKDGDLYYRTKARLNDDYDSHYIGGMGIEDLVHVAGFYE